MNVIALDYGKKYLGIAVSLDNSPAMPLTTLIFQENKPEANLEELLKIVKENQIERLVVGMPQTKIHSDEQQKEISEFIKKLEQILKDFKPAVKVETFDEKMTSKMAARYAAKDKEHQEAARIILEDWLASGT